ncbi:hypothetical protein AVEN_16225-1 [Araneus ventricosus]|nr:hypothetical protein AVEN_241008-1 [Araneus ventricosus]GBL94795.1 hypothetical protein AVEN_16225-1 [Araneus ventricosus]
MEKHLDFIQDSDPASLGSASLGGGDENEGGRSRRWPSTNEQRRRQRSKGIAEPTCGTLEAGESFISKMEILELIFRSICGASNLSVNADL